MYELPTRISVINASNYSMCKLLSVDNLNNSTSPDNELSSMKINNGRVGTRSLDQQWNKQFSPARESD